jgi:GNAT superfamily N-acetyltransferase
MSHGRETADPVVAVRRARAFDAPDLARIHVQAWSEAYTGLVPDHLIAAQTVQARTTQWRQTIASEAMTAWIATVDGRPAGLMSIGPRGIDPPDDGTVGEVYTLYVVATEWGRGAGSALWAAGMARLRATGLLPAGLWVIEGNERARAFYERRGWVFTGTTRQDSSFGDPIDEVRYVSEVTAGHTGGLGPTA